MAPSIWEYEHFQAASRQNVSDHQALPPPRQQPTVCHHTLPRVSGMESVNPRVAHQMVVYLNKLGLGLCGVQKASLLDPVFKKHPSRDVLTIDPKLLGHLVA